VTTRDDVAVMEEAFVASTTREVHPVHAIDDVRLPAAPGPVAADAAQRMRAHVAAELPA
jgi:branched-chain amino acid aminotransferase